MSRLAYALRQFPTTHSRPHSHIFVLATAPLVFLNCPSILQMERKAAKLSQTFPLIHEKTRRNFRKRTAKKKYTEQKEMMLEQKYGYEDENVSWEAEEREVAKCWIFSGTGIA